MAKPKTYPVELPDRPEIHEEKYDNLQEPLSGSKKVKNAQHSHDKHGEGS